MMKSFYKLNMAYTMYEAMYTSSCSFDAGMRCTNCESCCWGEAPDVNGFKGADSEE